MMGVCGEDEERRGFSFFFLEKRWGEEGCFGGGDGESVRRGKRKKINLPRGKIISSVT